MQYLKSLEELKNFILKRVPFLVVGSQTSTVIPYKNFTSKSSVISLTQMPKKMTLEGDVLEITGGVTWQEARGFLQAQKRTVCVAPTEELAQVLAGVATSATGEYSFAFGGVREQVVELRYMDYCGKEQKLEAKTPFTKDSAAFSRYQQDISTYQGFKNPPFPRLIKATDLLVGSEGQLGVITGVKIKTRPLVRTQVLALPLPHWAQDYEPHLEVYERVQGLRGDILCCELLDQKALQQIDKKIFTPPGDVLFLEIKESAFEKVYQCLLEKFSFLQVEDVLEITARDFSTLRQGVPRAIWEYNAERGLHKKGTDVQVLGRESFKKLLEHYRQALKLNIDYNLIGHFGDGHLHFNFLSGEQKQAQMAADFLKNFYQDIFLLQGSPFAEHGVGILKQPFIRKFYHQQQYDVFKELKDTHDPHRQFFPEGFMAMTSPENC